MARKTTNARRMFYLLLAPACFIVFAYPPARLSAWHGPESVLGIGAIALIWLVALAALLYSFAGPKMLVRYITVHWMGASFILLSLTALYEVARLILPLHDRAAAIWIVAIAGALIALAVAASHHLRVKHLRFESDKITRAHRIVQISDVHIGSRQGGYLARIVRRVNRLSPDLVAITGDLVDSSAVGGDALRSLRDLRARTLFTIGNHERYADLNKVIDMLHELGVEPLRQMRVRTDELEVIGIDDADAHDQVARQLPTIEPAIASVGAAETNAETDDRYTILLYHRPLGWEAAIAHGVDLMLCGHTHNGQIFPFNYLVKHQFRRICGLYREGDAHLYVSPGTGTWGPLMRLGSCNEITCIDLHPARPQ